jgi:hypothetical protein
VYTVPSEVTARSVMVGGAGVIPFAYRKVVGLMMNRRLPSPCA